LSPAKIPYGIVWRPMAELALDDIVDYIAQDNPALAVEFVLELRDKAAALALHPMMGRSGRPGLPSYVRELVVHRNYIVFYRVLREARTVEILQVKHAAQR